MSCPVAAHALGECGCFKPRDYQALVEKERQWLGLLLYMAHRRAWDARGFEQEIITAMLRGRAQWLRN